MFTLSAQRNTDAPKYCGARAHTLRKVEPKYNMYCVWSSMIATKFKGSLTNLIGIRPAKIHKNVCLKEKERKWSYLCTSDGVQHFWRFSKQANYQVNILYWLLTWPVGSFKSSHGASSWGLGLRIWSVEIKYTTKETNKHELTGKI